ncbi:MAG TPA: response regulator [Gammaproteobacteria bacterium]|nr:response regulator [Gammaproteobacteria bacterium]
MNAVKILLVEDNEFNSDMLSQRLEGEGYHVTLAVNGEDAIKAVKNTPPDIILMDMGLPIMDGWEATQHLKADPQTKHIPIISLTAHSMLGDRKKAMEAGCDEYETKPIDYPALLGKIEKLLKRSS